MWPICLLLFLGFIQIKNLFDVVFKYCIFSLFTRCSIYALNNSVSLSDFASILPIVSCLTFHKFSLNYSNSVGIRCTLLITLKLRMLGFFGNLHENCLQPFQKGFDDKRLLLKMCLFYII